MIPPSFISEFQNCGHKENKAKQKKLIWEEDLYKEDGADRDGRKTRQVGGDTNHILHIFY